LAFAAMGFPRLATARRLLGMLVDLAVAGLATPELAALLMPAYPTSFYESPTGFTRASVAVGAALYPEHCAGCHGPRGFGDGPVSKSLGVRPGPLTGFHMLERSDGEMFWILTAGVPGAHGKLGMPRFSDRLSEDERWALIDYVRALAGAEPDDGAKPVHHHH
jgi:mono/diheme cytochrome c family protein